MDIGQRNFCRAGQRAGIERIHAALQILPFAPIPLNESVSLGRTPRACFVKGETFLAIFLPAVEQRVEHSPDKINKIVGGEKHGSPSMQSSKSVSYAVVGGVWPKA